MKAGKWAGLLLIPALMLTACGGRQAVRAEASSSSVQADKTAGAQAAKVLLPAKYQTTSGLVSLAFNRGERQALARQLAIPKATAAHPAIPGYPDNRQLFEKALANAALAAYQQGAFKKTRDPAQQAAHLKFISVTFPALVKQYQ